MSERKPIVGVGGVPFCTESECPSYDGKRCRETGFRPGTICEPEVRGMAVDLLRLRASPPPAPVDVLAETDENVERVARAAYAAAHMLYDGYSAAPVGRAVLRVLREARDLPPNSDSKGRG